MQGRLISFIILMSFSSYGQEVRTTQVFTEKRWVFNSNLNLPAAKFLLADKVMKTDVASAEQTVKGYLELFSSFGIGLSMNFGDAIFLRIWNPTKSWMMRQNSPM